MYSDNKIVFVTHCTVHIIIDISTLRAFIITINSFGTELTKDDREKLYPTCGKLAPDGLKALARADDYDQVDEEIISNPAIS